MPLPRSTHSDANWVLSSAERSKVPLVTELLSVSNQPPVAAHVIFRFGIGGLENGLVNFINHMPEQLCRHVVVSLTEVSQSLRTRISRRDVRFYELHKPPGHLWRLFPRLVRLFRTISPAIVHTRNLAALEASFPAWVARVPVRIHGEHGRDIGDFDGLNRKYQLVRSAYSPFVQQWIALSKDLAAYLEQRVGIDGEHIAQIYNGVDTHVFHPPIGGRPPIAGCPFSDPDLWLVGTVGRLEIVKNQTMLARAFVEALKLDPSLTRRIRLVIVGEGSLRASVEKVLLDGNAAQYAWLPGERDDVAAIMRGLDCFVLPSLAEGVSNTILEAMASALPIIATAVGGNPELIEHEVSGRLVPSGDSGALARAMIAYLRDWQTARQHADAARLIVQRRFSLQRMVNEYSQLYATMLGRHAGRLLHSSAI
jgi:sugar transferase (PEP-CTERM/EpsH1 system associated)